MNRRIYLDYSATTPLRPEARTAMEPYVTGRFGNPSSLHAYGREARVAVEDARDRVRSALGAPHGRLVFVGSGSASDGLAILGYARRHPGATVIRSAIEHKAVIESTRALERAGHDVQATPVDDRGVVDVAALDDMLGEVDGLTLVSVMWVNNETGVIQPVAEIARACRSHGALFHCDAVQAFGKVDLEPTIGEVDLLSISAHKIGGPKGTGALLIREGLELEPLVYGGGQEFGLRSGTENVAAIVGFAAAAARSAETREAEATRARALRDGLESALQRAIPDLTVNGRDAPRVTNVLNVSIPGADVEGLLTSLDLEGICVSSGSACTTGTVKASHVIRAMGRSGDAARNTLRFSLGWGTTDEEIDQVIETVPTVVRRVRQLASA